MNEAIIAGLKRLATLARNEMSWADEDHTFWLEVSPATDWIESLNGHGNATTAANRPSAKTAGEAAASDGDSACPAVPAPSSDELIRKLVAAGVFKGVEGLEGLLKADHFWEQQSYGTRLYYGPGIADYLHRGVLEAAVNILKQPESQPPSDVQRDAERYRWLRNQHWNDSAVAVVTDPKINVRLGVYCPSETQLDDFIDAARAVTAKHEDHS
ncbi:MAG TPA: hypothetical protein VGD45_20315 [Steroidobacter sp.]|uniref:hypothetical protein n=1 Tax=Steroidobacter sp. TaxID=1978227 RepID=UPI002ED8793B